MTNKKIQTYNNLKAMRWIAILVFFTKFLIILNIRPTQALDVGNGVGVFLKGILNGSDGENYLKGLIALINNGIYAKDEILSYFPAGYPIIIFLISKIHTNSTLILLSSIQSIFFSFSVYALAKQLLKTKLNRYTILIFLMIIFNPTLTSSSLIIGYESITASGTILIIAWLIKYRNLKDVDLANKIRIVSAISIVCGFITFLQPRLILGSLAIIFIAIMAQEKIKTACLLVSISTLITLIFPTALVYRNNKSSGIMAVSTNLGTTMNLGAGEETTGSYWDKKRGVECVGTNQEFISDSELIRCVLNWYVKHPEKSVKLFIFKSSYFWSPWVGPLEEGTSGRNPWLRYGPYSSLSQLSIYKAILSEKIEIIISIIWQLMTLFFLCLGLINLFKQESNEQFLGIILFVLVVANWGISLLTIGDNRFRIPILGAIIILQSLGALFTISWLRRFSFFEFRKKVSNY